MFTPELAICLAAATADQAVESLGHGGGEDRVGGQVASKNVFDREQSRGQAISRKARLAGTVLQIGA